MKRIILFITFFTLSAFSIFSQTTLCTADGRKCSASCASQVGCTQSSSGTTYASTSVTVSVPAGQYLHLVDINCGSGSTLDASNSEKLTVNGTDYKPTIRANGDVCIQNTSGAAMDATIFLQNNRSDECISYEVTATSPGGSCSPLPVELLYFTATQKEKSILLNWATASEINNDYFAVEYSRDGLGFKEIAEIDGMGNSLEKVNYEFMHKKPNTGTNYYRLKQMDFDGSFEYSNIVSVTIENDKGISIQPNLVKDNIKLVVKKGYSKEQSIQIYNIVGAKVLEARLPAGTLQKTIDVHHLQSGHYFVRVNTNEEPKVLRFVKM